jgi:hypothetical protein
MAIIFCSSDTAPLISVIICCTTVTTLNILSSRCLQLEPGLTDLLVVVVQQPRNWASRLRLGPEVAVCHLAVLPQMTRLKWRGWKRTPSLLWSWGTSVAASSAVAPWLDCSHCIRAV